MSANDCQRITEAKDEEEVMPSEIIARRNERKANKSNNKNRSICMLSGASIADIEGQTLDIKYRHTVGEVKELVAMALMTNWLTLDILASTKSLHDSFELTYLDNDAQLNVVRDMLRKSYLVWKRMVMMIVSWETASAVTPNLVRHVRFTFRLEGADVASRACLPT